MKKILTSTIPATCWMVMIIILLSIPGSEFPQVGLFTNLMLDKWAHIILFFVLVLLCIYPYKQLPQLALKRKMSRILLFSTVFGIVMEFVQHFLVPKRSFEFGDIVADFVGAFGGYLFMRNYLLKKEKAG